MRAAVVYVLVLATGGGCGFPDYSATPAADVSPTADSLTGDAFESSVDATAAEADAETDGSSDASKGDEGDGADSCGATPALPPPPSGTGGDVTCPRADIDGGTARCDKGENCCQAPASSAASSTCGSVTCPTGFVRWDCNTPAACGLGQRCCASVAESNVACGFVRATIIASHCIATCGAADFTLCRVDTQCTAGQKCRAFRAPGLDLGKCDL